MSRKIVSGMMLTLLLIGMLTLTFNIQPAKAEPKTIYVDDDNTAGPWNGTPEHPYQNITSAYGYATSGDTIFVFNGTYYEHVVVEKSVSLVGENRQNTIVDGSGSGTVFYVDNTPNVNITGFTIRNGSSGVVVWFPNTWAKGSIRNNIMTNCSARCISISPDFTNERLYNYTIQNNEIYGDVSLHCLHNAVIADNNITQAWWGLALYYTLDSTISNNTITDCEDHGIFCHLSERNKFYGNTLIDNYVACTLSDSDHNVFVNNFFNNIGNLVLSYADSNCFYHNSFVATGIYNVYLSQSFNNDFDNGYPSGGNYWYDYEGDDYFSGPNQDQPGSDGIGDTPYTVDGDQDDYPLMNPVTSVNIAVTDVTQSKTIVGQGYCLYINATIENQGDVTEIFDVTIYANTTSIATQTVTLASGNYTNIALTWNTTGFAKGKYTISAYAGPVPGELYTTDNNFILQDIIRVVMPGDGDADGDIDIYDVVMITSIYGSKKGDPSYNANLDWYDDGSINIYDVVVATSRYGQKDP